MCKPYVICCWHWYTFFICHLCPQHQGYHYTSLQCSLNHNTSSTATKSSQLHLTFKPCAKIFVIWFSFYKMNSKTMEKQWTIDSLQAGNEVICIWLSTMTQFYCQEMNNVAKSFKHIKWTLLYTTPKKWTFKQENFIWGKI